MQREDFTKLMWENFLTRTTNDGTNYKMEIGLSIENKRFTENIFHLMSVGVSFQDCVFEEMLSFSPATIHSDVFFIDCVFKKGFFIQTDAVGRMISFLRCSVESETAIFGDLKITRLDMNMIFVSDVVLSDGASIEYIQMGGMDRNKYEKLSVFASAVTNRLEINHTEINSLYFGRSTLAAEMAVVNSHIGKMKLDNFRNDGSLRFLNCRSTEKEGSSILINQSNIGKAEFFKFDFSSFGQVNITNSVFFESVFVNCEWTKDNLISEVVHFSDTLKQPQELEKRVLAESRKDVFKQIKAAYAKQGDYVQEQFFHGLEMDEYYKSLSIRGNFWTKAILRLSSWTSDYGQSFSRPVVCIVIVDTVLFWCMFKFHSTPYNSYDFTHVDNYINTIASILNLMNPLHKTDNLTGAPFIIDTVCRIFSSYMIYNMIRATRRFVK